MVERWAQKKKVQKEVTKLVKNAENNRKMGEKVVKK